MPFVDIFASDFRLPERVCILAPGPNGAGHYSEIPAGFSVMAVAKAVLIPEVEADIWVMNHAHQEWFEEADAAFHGTCIFGDEAMMTRPHLAGKSACYYFTTLEEPLDPNVMRAIDGVVRVGGSIVGCALQLAYNFGSAEILLCGADMSGDGYWDGTTNVQNSHGAVWPAAQRLNLLLRWLIEEKRMRISTLSQTMLDVPAYSLQR